MQQCLTTIYNSTAQFYSTYIMYSRISTAMERNVQMWQSYTIIQMLKRVHCVRFRGLFKRYIVWGFGFRFQCTEKSFSQLADHFNFNYLTISYMCENHLVYSHQVKRVTPCNQRNFFLILRLSNSTVVFTDELLRGEERTGDGDNTTFTAYLTNR